MAAYGAPVSRLRFLRVLANAQSRRCDWQSDREVARVRYIIAVDSSAGRAVGKLPIE